MNLTSSNYFSQEAHRNYMSVSQFKDFLSCEAQAMAKLNGEFEPKPITAFLEGSYVHAWNEGALDEFKANNPDLYSSRGKTAGQLKSNFQHCNKMIEVLEADPLALKVLEGQKEVIFTGELFGAPWKIMIDSYNPSKGVFADLKALKEIDGRFWDGEERRYVNFIRNYGYDLQMAVYAEIERQANGRAQNDWLIPHMVIVTKQDPPDHEVIYFDHDIILDKLSFLEHNIQRVIDVKSGQVEPTRCGKCDYCRVTKKVKKIKHYLELDI